jgi:hypothetical protein
VSLESGAVVKVSVAEQLSESIASVIKTVIFETKNYDLGGSYGTTGTKSATSKVPKMLSQLLQGRSHIEQKSSQTPGVKHQK